MFIAYAERKTLHFYVIKSRLVCEGVCYGSNNVAVLFDNS